MDKQESKKCPFCDSVMTETTYQKKEPYPLCFDHEVYENYTCETCGFYTDDRLTRYKTESPKCVQCGEKLQVEKMREVTRREQHPDESYSFWTAQFRCLSCQSVFVFKMHESWATKNDRILRIGEPFEPAKCPKCELCTCDYLVESDEYMCKTCGWCCSAEFYQDDFSRFKLDQELVNFARPFYLTDPTVYKIRTQRKLRAYLREHHPDLSYSDHLVKDTVSKLQDTPN